ncbi:hypothetical protein Gogos_019286, partial [Gossypium gossypioides]|nr:hypothetical protein [Gossypium gossypioides]
FKGRLLIQKERVRQGIGDGELCTACGNTPEDVIHVSRDCSVTKEVWYRLIPTAKRGNFFFGRRSVTGESNWVDLNTDGAMKLDSGMATAGGILKDS